MARINLLPWRQERRAEQQRQLLTITGLSVVLMLLIVVAVHLEISRQISSQNARNSYIQTEIQKVDTLLTEIHNLEKAKKQLLARMKIIQQLQQNRPEVVHLFDEIARQIPEGVYLRSFQQTGKQLKLEGIAQSNARVSAFMRNIASSAWMTDPKLDVIKTDAKTKDSENTREFVLNAVQASNVEEKIKTKP